MKAVNKIKTITYPVSDIRFLNTHMLMMGRIKHFWN